MRLPEDEELAFTTIAAAADAGITVYDTAHAYGTEPGANERLLSRALRACGARAPRVVTKGGMTRAGGAWIPDGRAKAIRAGCEASLAALDGRPIDLFLLHAPDQRTPWRTSVRALARLVDDGLVERVGVSNVNRSRLDEALGLAPIAAVQVALSVLDDRALRGGVLERCVEAGIALIAHSPLGGPRRTGRLPGDHALAHVASARDASAAEVALAWLLDLSPAVVAIPGARSPEAARSAARAATLALEDGDRVVLADSLGRREEPARRRARRTRDGEVVLVMGIPGAGKSRVAEAYTGRGYLRLNRDERGGSLRVLAADLEEALSSDVRHAVLDNTYLSRAARSYVVEAAGRHGLPVRCVWLDTPLVQAQVNLVRRMLDRLGSLPGPEELKRLARKPGVLTPTSQMRALRELEPPSEDEGFAAIEHVPFERAPESAGRTGVFVAASALRQAGWAHAHAEADPGAPHLVFDWSPHGDVRELAGVAGQLERSVSGPVETALCPHGGGPPICWCRPPLPGLPLAFAQAHGIDPARSTLVGTSTAHRSLANALGAQYVEA